MKRERRGRVAAGSPPARRGRAQLAAARRERRPGESVKGPVTLENGAGPAHLNTDLCRLCHGCFPVHSMRLAFSSSQVDNGHAGEEDKGGEAPQFCSDFQGLVGVAVACDPNLSRYICQGCHAQFYQCRRILLAFLQRVNLSPTTARDGQWNKLLCSNSGSHLPASITSSSQCLHNLVSWSHQHASGCSSCPGLQEVLEGQYQGSLMAVWGCGDGHSYTLEAQVAPGMTQPATVIPWAERDEQPWRTGASGTKSVLPEEPPSDNRTQTDTEGTDNTAVSQGKLPTKETGTPTLDEPLDGAGDSELSDRDFFSEDEEEEERRKGSSSDELFVPYPEKRAISPKKVSRETKKALEPKVRKKPGPKPGWKKKLKPEREELPNIYKCPHQGCTAVYRGVDGMKKHIKEHHEEVRERPCPHPGCNKVFMIDRYLQRHLKLIHTEVRNYICDQCGQTFKQRKHLSVHQMRHSGAKPLQCEVCGFQCRQRASLKYHMTKHKAEAELEFACELCAKRFEKAHNLNVHMSMVHPLTHVGGGGLASS